MTETLRQWQGQVLNVSFPLREYLGGSENSAVFATEHCEPEPEKAVIKLVRVEPGRARQELGRAEAAAKLSHASLLRTFHVGLRQAGEECLLYTAMEYAPESMAQVLPERPLTAPEMNEVLSAALGALQYIHQAGFVHGRLKPTNIMAVEDRVKISCDGLFRAEDSVSFRALDDYDPPEAAAGMITPAGDVWSLAVLMVEALTQQPPTWEGSPRKLKLPEMLPDPFSEIARHCLQDDPRLRWTTGQIADRLRRAAAKPTASAQRNAERRSSSRVPVLPLTIFGLGLSAMLIGARIVSSPAGVRQPVPVREQVASKPVSKQDPPKRVQTQPMVVDEDYRRPSPFAPRQSNRGSLVRVPPRETAAPRAQKVLPSVAAIHPSPSPVSSADRLIPAPGNETGRAAFFSSNANGGLTASGARLNSEELMAAHASYPLGSRVRVTNLANGKTVQVHIVDRFPGGAARIINVSAAAARELDFIRAGTAVVRLELVPPGTGP